MTNNELNWMDLPLLTFNFRVQTRIDCISRYWCPNWMKITPIGGRDSQLSIAASERVWGHLYLEIRSIRVWSIFLLLGHFSDSRRSEKWPKSQKSYQKVTFRIHEFTFSASMDFPPRPQSTTVSGGKLTGPWVTVRKRNGKNERKT